MKYLLHAALLLAFFSAMSTAQSASLPASVDVNQAAAMQKQGVLLLDVREPDEYAVVHARNVTLIPLGQLAARLGEISQYKDKPTAVICRSGKRSSRAAEILRDAGFANVTNVEGGTTAWESAGLPVTKK